MELAARKEEIVQRLAAARSAVEAAAAEHNETCKAVEAQRREVWQHLSLNAMQLANIWANRSVVDERGSL